MLVKSLTALELRWFSQGGCILTSFLQLIFQFVQKQPNFYKLNKNQMLVLNNKVWNCNSNIELKSITFKYSIVKINWGCPLQMELQNSTNFERTILPLANKNVKENQGFFNQFSLCLLMLQRTWKLVHKYQILVGLMCHFLIMQGTIYRLLPT